MAKPQKLTILNTIDNLITATENGIDIGLEKTGETGVVNMRVYADDFTASGRLNRGISWATKNNTDNMSPDRVPRPEDNNTVNIGTSVPYASAVDSGYAFATLENGEIATVPELTKRIAEWTLQKGGFFFEDENARLFFANRVAINLIENGHDAQPFFNNSMTETIWNSVEIFYQTEMEAIKKVKSHPEQIIDVELKL